MNLPDYFRTELANCQNINEITKLVAVVKHLAVVRAIELNKYSERNIAANLGITNTRVGQIKRNYPQGGK